MVDISGRKFLRGDVSARKVVVRPPWARAAPGAAQSADYTALLAVMGWCFLGIALMQAAGNARAVVPFTLIIDRQGKVIGSKLGAMNHAEVEAAANQQLKP